MENMEIQYKAKSYLWLKILVPVVALLILGAFILKIFVLPDYFCKSAYSSIAEKVSNSQKVMKNGKLEKYEALYEINSDLGGFIYLPQQKEGFPFVKPQNESEEFYKNHLFNLKSNKYGTPYTKTELDKNGDNPLIVIFGNSFGDNLLLGEIKNYLDEDYAKENKILNFSTIYGSGVYTVFSAFQFSGEEPFLIDRQSFLNDKLFSDYGENLYKNSQIDMNVHLNTQDKLLVFVAEAKDKTYVLAARMLRAEETEDYIIEKAEETISDKTEDKVTSSVSSSKKEPSKDNKDEETDNIVVSKPSSTSNKKPASQNLSGRIEQTGLTDNLDKTVQVEVNNVVTMLDLVGTDKTTAKSIVSSMLGLDVEFKNVESTEKRNTIIDQSVAPDAEVSTDVKVILYVSAGLSKGKTLVPELIGNLESTAEMILDNSDLYLGKVTKAESSLEKGTIISQSIEPNTETNVNTKVNIVVSDGSIKFKTVKMPKLTGKTKAAAQTAVKKAGLKVGSIKTVTSSKAAGTVVSQEVPAGENIEEGGTISFSISNGSKVNNLTVTNMSGWSVTIDGKSYPSGAKIKGDYMDIIPCIVEAEMGSGYEIEALKAQSIAAYCWLINAGSTKGSAPAVPMKTPGNRAIKAAKEVSGIKVKKGSETAQTYYYAISAGYTANCKDVWWADISYLRAVESPGCKNASGYKTKVTYSAAEMRNMIESSYDISLDGVSKSDWFSIKYDENNAYARSVKIGGKKTVTGSSIRETLCNYELRSTAFKIKYNKSKDTFTFTVYGYGHGVGMSQVGANYYAKQGWNYESILLHYFPGTKLS